MQPTPKRSVLSSSLERLIVSHRLNRDALELEGHTELTTKIIIKLKAKVYECMVCFDSIVNSRIWSCYNCFALFHFDCILKWSVKSTEKIPLIANKNNAGDWRCPGCQYYYSERPVCVCYCGKTYDPPFSNKLVPNSCGEPCLRERKCPHKVSQFCLKTCHAGPCEPCLFPGPIIQCYCKKTKFQLNCGENPKQGRSCGEICSAKFEHCEHVCPLVCHNSPCEPCKQVVEKLCGCGKEKKLILCTESWNCGDVCGKLLECGNHRCEELCHEQSCSPCKFSSKSCPCGKTFLSRLDCTYPITLCDNICGKVLLCSQLSGVKHYCNSVCHFGRCPPCKESISVQCRCKSTSQTMVCEDVYKNGDSSSSKFTAFLPHCDTVCNKQLSCLKHTCVVVCCPSRADFNDPLRLHFCGGFCGKLLNCKKHHCERLCHKNNCSYCDFLDFSETFCPCGATAYPVPRLCGSPRPQCRYPCIKIRPCGHYDLNDSFTTHFCHFGPCPPCSALVEKWCMGGHELRKNVICTQNDISCGRICGKMLPCLTHKCTKFCHSSDCSVQNTTLAEGESLIMSCGGICGKLLQCGLHYCESKCHPQRDCYENQNCAQIVKLFCKCKRKCESVECYKFAQSSTINSQEVSPRKLEILPCDSECEKEQIKKVVNGFFGISDSFNNERIKHTEDNNEKETQTGGLFLVNLIKVNPATTQRLEEIFCNFIKDSHDTHLLISPVDSIQGRLTTELCKHYNLDIEIKDLRAGTFMEKTKSIRLTKKKTSQIPFISLFEGANLTNESNSVHTISTTTSSSSSSSTATHTLPISPPCLHIFRSYRGLSKRPYLLNQGNYGVLKIDHESTLAVFADPKMMRIALNGFNHPDFKISIYKENEPPVVQHLTAYKEETKINGDGWIVEKRKSKKVPPPKITTTNATTTITTTTATTIETTETPTKPKPKPKSKVEQEKKIIMEEERDEKKEKSEKKEKGKGKSSERENPFSKLDDQ